jgi:hypothetical protein
MYGGRSGQARSEVYVRQIKSSAVRGGGVVGARRVFSPVGEAA